MRRLLWLLPFCVLGLSGSGSETSPIAGTCSGGSGCKACSTCEHCKHCSKEGGRCSVCDPAYPKIELGSVE